MDFYADLHIHSRFSRATARTCDLPHLALWAQKKGIAVVGTGDFTHPAWRAEIAEQLVPAEPGLFRLAPELEREVAGRVPAACRRPVRFCLSVEIATIYKKGDKTRKIHHVVLAPDLEAVGRMVAALERIGNLRSDGRPILGLDSRDLLEIVLAAGEGCCLIPAHVWTPWFAVLGSKSGFDAIEDCYADLSDHIFALETGLSSDPAMNWRISALDRYRLVSNSDAHSPSKLGREACVFACELGYPAMLEALRTGEGYRGTVEFFPEEGKYHLDGHRKCKRCLEPAETRAHGGRCPDCGGLLTVGVVHRVDELADRSEAEALAAPPATAGPVRSLVPLAEVLSEILGVGPGSKRVTRTYEGLVDRLGPELDLLWSLDLEEVRRASTPLAAEALERLRSGRVIRQAGYDGEYGVIRLFEPGELDVGEARTLFAMPEPVENRGPSRAAGPTGSPAPPGATRSCGSTELDDDQRAAVEQTDGVLLVVAGPGSGKTLVLTRRLVRLIEQGVAPAAACLAITFTRRAADELRARLAALLPGQGSAVAVMTLHALGLEILRAHPAAAGLDGGFGIADEDAQVALAARALDLTERKARSLLNRLAAARRSGREPEPPDDAAALRGYRAALRSANLVDFEDLIRLAADLIESQPDLADAWRARYRFMSVDEAQDLDAQQQRLLLALAGPDPNLCAIGDPDQSIYGFRGADPRVFERLRAAYPQAREIRLVRNYRSGQAIVGGAGQVIRAGDGVDRKLAAMLENPERIGVHAAPTDKAEAEFVVHSIEQWIGGHSFFSIDSGRSVDGRVADLSFADFAVLYRTEAQAALLVEALARSGIPFQQRGHARLLELPAVRALADSLHAKPGSGDLVRRLKLRSKKVLAADSGLEPDAMQTALDLLAPLATACGTDTDRFLAELALGAQVDCFDPRADRVALLTLHAAKGLEFEVVFLTGCEDGLLPLRFGPNEAAAVDEERRLFYVGMTRAKSKLILTRAERRSLRGRKTDQAPSPFLAAVEADLQEAIAKRLPGRRKRRDDQMGLF